MGIARGPNIVKDNLVFGYDTGYGVADNSTATRFYAGKTVDNEFYNSGANGNILDHSSGYGGIGTAQSGVLDASGTTENTVYRKTGKIRFGPTGGQDIGTLVNGNTYTFSIYLRHVAGQTQGGSMEFDIVDQTSGGTNFTGTLGSNMTYEWKRFSVTNTHTNSSNYHFIDLGTYQGTNVFEWCMPQIEQGTDMSPFTNTERSSTQSLIDLKRTTDISVSNVSFDSTGQPEFDGTDDRLDGINGVGISNYSNPFSMECVFKVPTDGTWANSYSSNVFSIAGSYAGHYGIYKSGTDTIGFQIRDATTGGYCTSAGHSKNVYHHVVTTFGGGSGMKLYINGELESSNTTSFTGTPDSTDLYIGGQRAFGGDVGSWFEGEIPISKYYTQTLSADEVKQNYNAYKNRFNI